MLIFPCRCRQSVSDAHSLSLSAQARMATIRDVTVLSADGQQTHSHRHIKTNRACDCCRRPDSSQHTHTHTHARTETHRDAHAQRRTCTETHTHARTHWFLWFTGTLHRHNGFYTVQTVCAIALHLNLALKGKFLHFYFLKKLTLYDL